MPEQLIDTRFPGQQFPVGSVVTFLDRHRRAVFGTVAELRRHEAIVAGGEAGRWRVGYAGLQLIKAGPTGGATMQQVVDHAGQLLERHLNTGAPATWWRFRFETAMCRAGICRYTTRTIALSVSYVLRAPWDDIRDTLLHEIAHAIVGPGHVHDAVWQTTARRIGCTAKPLQHRHPQPEAVDRGVLPMPRPVVPSTPNGDSTPTLDLSTVPLAYRMENQRPRGRPLTAAAHEPTCQDCSYDLMIDPMATGTVKRPSADPHRPRGREAFSAHPPTPVDDTPRGSPEQRAENTWARDPPPP